MTKSLSDVPPNEWTEYTNLRDRMEHIKQVTLRAEAAPPRRMRRGGMYSLPPGHALMTAVQMGNFDWEYDDPWGDS